MNHIEFLARSPLCFRRPQREFHVLRQGFAFLRNNHILIGLFQRNNLRSQGLDLLIVDLLDRCFPRRYFSGRSQPVCQRFRRVEHRLHLVIIFLRNRIELVVMATRTAHGHAHESVRCRGHEVVQFVEARHVVLDVVLEAESQITWPNSSILGVGRNFITRNLFLHKLVVRLVGVEGTNYVIAVPPGVGFVIVILEATGIGVTNDIEPMPPPPFAVVRRSQQLVHQLGEGIRRLVRHEPINLLRSWRHPP